MVGLLRLRTYEKASYANLLRLAKWLGMDVTPGMSHSQLAKEVHWKVVFT